MQTLLTVFAGIITLVGFLLLFWAPRHAAWANKREYIFPSDEACVQEAKEYFYGEWEADHARTAATMDKAAKPLIALGLVLLFIVRHL